MPVAVGDRDADVFGREAGKNRPCPGDCEQRAR